MEIRRFNRHENMSSEVRKKILEIITELHDIDSFNVNPVINMLYGFFDGYDYTEKIIFSTEFAEITYLIPDLGADISEICGIIEKYPTEIN
jgi:hypothetical protein